MRVYVFRLAMLTLAVLGPVVARGDDQQIAQRAGPFQQLDVSGMQQIKDAVGEHDLLTAATPARQLGQQLVQSQ